MACEERCVFIRGRILKIRRGAHEDRKRGEMEMDWGCGWLSFLILLIGILCRLLDRFFLVPGP